MLLVDDREAEALELDAFLEQGVRADRDLRCRRCEVARARACARAPVRLPVSSATGRSSGASQARKLRACCSASSSVGAMTAAW